MTLRSMARPFTPAPDRLVSPAVRSWRVTTAVRVFLLALATGQVLQADTLGSAGGVLLALVPVAAACCAIELHEAWQRARWVTCMEGLVAVVLLGLADAPVEPLLVYLTVPAVVAGVRHGATATVVVSLVNAAAVLGLAASARVLDLAGPSAGSLLPWLVIGLGAGLLAASQTRSVRRLEAAQAPYVAAHRLVGQLHTVAHELPFDLDVALQARAMQEAFRASTRAECSAVLVRRDTGGLEVLTSSQATVGAAEEVIAGRCVTRAGPVRQGGVVALPLRVGDQVFGALVLGGRFSLSAVELGDLQEQLDEQAIRLDTALLLDDVRSLATTEERNRLARDIHDGLAQQLVRLGYLADDLAALSTDPVARQGADDLRAEVTRLVRNLRFSVFDLRQDLDAAGSLSAALSEYVRQLGSDADLRVHLTLDERDATVTRRTEEEVFRIAREAIGNVHKHARSANLWVRLTTHGRDVRLVVEDDGVGSAAPRAGHFGLHTMRERAERIHADLEIAGRPDGGTVVTLQTRASPSDREGSRDDDPRLARR